METEMPWEILEIEEGSDKQTIKRAYARLLKHNKPDENADGFQVLHDAYQYALFLAEELSGSGKVTVIDPQPVRDSPREFSRASDNSHAQEIIEPEALETAEDDYARKVTRFEALENDVFALIAEKNYSVDNWLFIEKEEWLSDIEFFRSFSDFMLEVIFENDINIATAPNLIHYLSSIFMWDSNIEELEERYSTNEIIGLFGTDFYSGFMSENAQSTRKIPQIPDGLKAIVKRFKSKNFSDMDEANLFLRIGAVVIDLLVLIMGMFAFFVISKALDQKLLEFFSLSPHRHFFIDSEMVLHRVNNKLFFQINAHYFIIGAFLTAWFQLTKIANKCRSSGEEIMEIMVVRNDMEVPDFPILLARYLLVAATLLLFPIALPVNIFLYRKYGRFFQDILTDTKVVRKITEDF